MKVGCGGLDGVSRGTVPEDCVGRFIGCAADGPTDDPKRVTAAHLLAFLLVDPFGVESEELQLLSGGLPIFLRSILVEPALVAATLEDLRARILLINAMKATCAFDDS